MKEGKIKRLKIEEVTPYWRNPRDNSLAVEKVKESIKAFGYNQPICVDSTNTIIVGHTRYKALKELGYTEIDVVETDLSPKEAKKYRIIDNKTSEYSLWTEDLKLELREVEDLGFMSQFFDGKIDLGLSFTDADVVTAVDIEKSGQALGGRFNTNDADKGKQQVSCPHCGNTFLVRFDSALKY